MSEPFWTIGMVTAWVIWRDVAKVRPYWHKASTRENPDSVIAMDLDIAMAEKGGDFVHFRTTSDAFQEIFREGAEGAITIEASAGGKLRGPIKRSRIAAWAAPSQTLSQIIPETGKDKYVEYHHPVVSRDDIIAAWPPNAAETPAANANQSIEAPSEPLRERQNVSEAQVRRWFVGEFLPANPKQVPKENIIKAAQVAMPMVTRHKVRKVMEQNWPNEWSQKPGPKGPRTGKNNPAE